MRLSKLTLCGFKSFADETAFTFDDAVTGIVGPNGCGKSNVVDAIKWVLGERSSKSLRGKEMSDVIFAGSAGRAPAGFASVTLTFENPEVAAPAASGAATGIQVPLASAPDAPGFAAEVVAASPAERAGEDEASPLDAAARGRRALPIDADTVEVERRLFRDGTSQYLINQRRARLRDIRDLFLDTGIGADAYSIIEQGKVDAMLLASSQERRSIFEEAAGVAKYKARRIEAQRKLERSQANLAGTRDQLASTERRLRIVRGQAVKARRFVELDQELAALRLASAFDGYHELRQRIEGLTSNLAALDERRGEAAKALALVEADREEAEIARAEAVSAQRALHDARTRHEHEGATARQKRDLSARALEDTRRRVEADQTRANELDARQAAARSDLEDARAQETNRAAALAEAEGSLVTAAEARARAMESLNDAQGHLSRLRASIAEADRERARASAGADEGARRMDAIAEQQAKLTARLDRLRNDREEALAAGAAMETAIGAGKSRAADLDASVAAVEGELASLSDDRRESAGRLRDLEQAFARADERRATLHEMVAARVGIGRAAAAVLQARAESGAFGGVIAPLADVITVSREHATVVEAALGARLRGLLVASMTELPSEAEREALPGRVLFLPLRAPGGVTANTVELPPGVRPVAALVEARAAEDLVPATDLRGLLDRLLARTYVVESLDAALLLGAGPLAGARFVTASGLVVEPDGTIAAGPETAEDAGAGLLSRRSELDELRAALAGLQSEIEARRAALAAVDARTSELASRRAELASALSQTQRDLIANQTRLERLGVDAARLARETESVQGEAHGLVQRREQARADREAMQARAEAMRARAAEFAEALASVEGEVQSLRQAAESAAERLTSAKVSVGTLGEQLAAARRERAALSGALDHATRQRAELTQQLERAGARQGELDREIAEAGEAVTRADEALASLAGELTAAQARVGEAHTRVEETATRLHAAREQAMHLDRDWQSIEIARREAEAKREALEERTQEDLRLDLAFEYADYRALLASGVAPVPHEAAQAPIAALRDEIRALGNVNLDSIDEEQTLAQRNDELIRQLADIDAAVTQLTDLITRLNDVSRTLFQETFTRIQEEFAGPNGMFRKLFGGGRAELKLAGLVKEVQRPDGTTEKVETEETDILESGIEVLAKPPGKEPRSISQLSGGEKTMTAVALLLSIFRSRPSCFCVLDEVDAALDEANVERYTRVIRQFTDLSHFVVITHNKRTMAAADRLYGVTMQERGVSTRVSVKFEQVGEGGAIRGVAAEAEGRSAAPNRAPAPELAQEPEGSPVGSAGPSAPAETRPVRPRRARVPAPAEPVEVLTREESPASASTSAFASTSAPAPEAPQPVAVAAPERAVAVDEKPAAPQGSALASRALVPAAEPAPTEGVRRRPVTMGWPGHAPSAKLREALKGLGAAGDEGTSNEGSTPN